MSGSGIIVALLLQGPPPQGLLDMIFGGTASTQIVLLILAAFSFWGWVLIIRKSRQFQEVRRQGDRFLEKMEHAQTLEEAYQAIIVLPESPYGRVFRQGLHFFRELRPGGLKEESSTEPGLSLTHLEALRLVLEKAEAEERDDLSRGLSWLAVIASVCPLLGLMGTVIGIMNVFLGIAASGSTNIGAVAPGVGGALVTTVAGLAAAIPAVIFYNHFVAKLNLVSGELEGFSSEFIGTLAREGRI